MKEKYRLSNKEDEVKKIITHSNAQKSILWQNNEQGREIFPVKEISISSIIKTLQVELAKDSVIDSKSPVYMWMNYNDSFFKSGYICQDGSKLSIHLPRIVQTKEFRAAPRKAFDYYDDIFVNLFVSRRQNITKPFGMKFKLLNISRTGACFLLSERNLEFFKNCDVFLLSHIKDIPLLKPVLADVVYINEFEKKSTVKSLRFHRVGIRFHEELTAQTLVEMLK